MQTQPAPAVPGPPLQETQNEDPDPKTAASQFIASFQSAFRTRTRGALNSDGYYVITAARSNQYSQEGEITTGGGSKVMGYFTFGFCLGCGYNGVADQTGNLFPSRRPMPLPQKPPLPIIRTRPLQYGPPAAPGLHPSARKGKLFSTEGQRKAVQNRLFLSPYLPLR